MAAVNAYTQATTLYVAIQDMSPPISDSGRQHYRDARVTEANGQLPEKNTVLQLDVSRSPEHVTYLRSLIDNHLKSVKHACQQKPIKVCTHGPYRQVADADSTEDEYGFGETCDDCGFRIFASPEDLDETHRNIRESLDRVCQVCHYQAPCPLQGSTHHISKTQSDSDFIPLPSSLLRGRLNPLPSESTARSSNSTAIPVYCESTARSSNSTATMERKEYQCKKCRVHGVDAPIKGHKGICPWQHCACKDCEQVSSYRRQHVMDGRERAAPKEMRACDVIGIANMTRKDIFFLFLDTL
ncbi:hypothetical protein Bbelb_021250 [Branchiostoma belcheri]|nr:hypothetical protein Bbelb_021250 [Branchiostoma belcheri]